MATIQDAHEEMVVDLSDRILYHSARDGATYVRY